ncbi:MAG: tRNA pseudouridine(55) synthase TruB [Gemmatimonadota bacterium]|nr:tRNA pseudouridine(55) synthase TruB [Gemmatimonadota bacterium]
MAPSREPRVGPIDGLLLVDKPAGVSSHDVVLVARRALGERRIGHAGTLDPFATGLLVLLTGRATRLLPYLDGEPKVYDATVRFGAETETDDLLGAITRSAPPPQEAVVRAALPALTGDLFQRPPDYSAKRVGGRRAYQAARSGEMLELAPVAVRVHEWHVHRWREGEATAEMDVTVVCGGGTYIRALGRDLGRLVGSAAHLSALRRTRSGRFSVDRATSLEMLRDGSSELHPAAEALGRMPVQTLGGADVRRIERGLTIVATVEGEQAALLTESGALLAVADRQEGQWQPRVVLHES